MESGDLSKNFIETILSLTSIRNLVKDSFFYDRITDKIFGLSAGFFNLIELGQGNNVSQHRLMIEKCFADIAGLGELLKELRYLHLVDDYPLLLKTEYCLLVFRLDLLKIVKGFREDKIEDRQEVKQNIIQQNKPTTTGQPRQSSRLNESKKKILDYIKLYPNRRTKDIIYEFNSLSGRTVKRNLTDLLRSGLVRKRIDNKAVYYYAGEIQSL